MAGESPHSAWPDWIKAGLRDGSISPDAAPHFAEAELAKAESKPPGRRRAPRLAGEYENLFPAWAPLGPPIEDQPRPRAAAAPPPLLDRELHEQLFGSHVYAPGHSAEAAADPGHSQYFVGQHIHRHASYDGQGGTHVHVHEHASDGNHAPGDLHPHPAG